ncbi:MAG: hypothetical protein HY268_15195 [Deltaproteobacteria bacterium]|nr:hypothetical protein [Deltaproteobacteria bacterium]
MEKLDRLGWAAGITFSAYGLRIGIRVNNAEVLEQLLGLLPPGWKPSAAAVVDRLYSLISGGTGPRPTVRRFNLLYADAVRLMRTLDLAEVFTLLESHLQLYVAEAARRRLFVHAGVVAWRGQAVVIPGRSFSGKTSLVEKLVQAGATYYSDEYAVFDARGRVHPFPRPLSIRDETGRLLKKCPAQALGGTIGVKPLPVGLIIVSEYRRGSRWRPQILSPGQATLALLAHTVSARRQPQFAFATLPQVVSPALALKGVRGEAQELVDMLLNDYGNWPNRGLSSTDNGKDLRGDRTDATARTTRWASGATISR